MIISNSSYGLMTASNVSSNSIWDPWVKSCKYAIFRVVTHDAAQRAAVVYSLLATCKAHSINEREWLEDVLNRIPKYELGGKDSVG